MAEYLAIAFCLFVLAIPCESWNVIFSDAKPDCNVRKGNNQVPDTVLPTNSSSHHPDFRHRNRADGGSKQVSHCSTVVDPNNVTIFAPEYSSRLKHSGSIIGQTGNLDLTFTNLQDSDATTYYCYISFLTDEVGEEHSTEVVFLHNMRGHVPSCTGSQVENALINHITITSAKAGKCPNGIAGRSEALLMNFCSGPDISEWTSGTKVMDLCCQIPKYTPVGTFEFDLYAQDERGMSGVFLECTDDGFKMATQLCGHYPIEVTLRKNGGSGLISDADNYYIVDFQPVGHLGIVG